VRRSDALAELELKTDATASDIKAAYRDLVKVWHPDRFPADDRLRLRAEERLRRINEAYRTLESGEPDPEAPPAPPSTIPPHAHTAAQGDAALRIWMYLTILVLTVAFLAYAADRHRQASQADREPVPFLRTSEPATDPPPQDDTATPTPRSSPKPTLPARVTPLSEAQMERIESACGAFSPASQQYAICVQSHLSAEAGSPHAVTPQHTLPALDGLTADERRSVDRVCATDPDYNQCAAAQLAKLAAAPQRPDLSRLSPRDRAAVDRACSSARDHDGPAAPSTYDRCIVEFERMLASHPN